VTEVGHTLEDCVDLGYDVFTVDNDRRAAWSTQRDVEQPMAATALLLDRSTSTAVAKPESIWFDCEAPAGSPTARILALSFTYRGSNDDHLSGQGCLALEPVGPATDNYLVAFACGCRAHVAGRLLEPR
jgi:hypothetical protein